MRKRLVLIVGAGASNDLNPHFALGTELLQQISEWVTDCASIHGRQIFCASGQTEVQSTICKSHLQFQQTNNSGNRTNNEPNSYMVLDINLATVMAVEILIDHLHKALKLAATLWRQC